MRGIILKYIKETNIVLLKVCFSLISKTHFSLRSSCKMQLGEISFCDKIGYNVKHDGYKESILRDLEANYGFKVISRHHENFDPKSTSTQRRVNSIPHLVSTKSNGNPYLLYLTKYNCANQCIFIDKKIQHGYFLPRMICVKLWFNDRLFENTLFDGEMVKDNDNNWTYIINDIIAKQNNALSNLKLVQRMNIVYNTLDENYFEDDTATCSLRVKKYFKVEDIPYIMNEFIPNLNYTCRGLYFKPIYSNFRDLLYNFNPSLIKSVVRTKLTDITQKSFLSKSDSNRYESNEIAKKRRMDNNTTRIDDLDRSNLKTHSKACDVSENNSDKADNGVCSGNSTHVSIIEPPYKGRTEIKTGKTGKTETIFSVKKTKMPDVYEMFKYIDVDGIRELSSSSEMACVQDRKTSFMLRRIFNGLTFLERKDFICVFNDKFKKWQPIHEVLEVSNENIDNE